MNLTRQDVALTGQFHERDANGLTVSKGPQLASSPFGREPCKRGELASMLQA